MHTYWPCGAGIDMNERTYSLLAAVLRPLRVRLSLVALLAELESRRLYINMLATSRISLFVLGLRFASSSIWVLLLWSGLVIASG